MTDHFIGLGTVALRGNEHDQGNYPKPGKTQVIEHPLHKLLLRTNPAIHFIYLLIGKKNTRQSSFRSVDPEKAKEYAGEDADITWQIAEILKEHIKDQGFSELSDQIEMPLIPVLMKISSKLKPCCIDRPSSCLCG